MKSKWTIAGIIGGGIVAVLLLALAGGFSQAQQAALAQGPGKGQGMPPERLLPEEEHLPGAGGRAAAPETGATRIAASGTLLWQTERVDAPPIFSWMGPRSLVLDASGHPHIAYGEDYLYYARHDGTSWHIETVDSAGGVGKYTSLALDASGRPHISYYDSINGDLKHAYFDGSAWHLETVDSAGDVGWNTSLALDGSGRPHISYYDYTNGDLKYAYFVGSAWQITIVDSAGNVGGFTSLALDSSGRPHISYYDSTNGDLKYAYFDGSAWHLETVDSAGNVGGYTSLALDSSGRPHISYCDMGSFDLKYAYFDGSAWHLETVDSVGAVGGYTSLALDGSGRPHISYWDMGYRDLKYAYFDGSVWHPETVDSAGKVGEYTSLALDGSGRPHISYYDFTNGNLKYAYFDGTDWHRETVDSARYAGWYTSLALDTSGRPHISYCLSSPAWWDSFWVCDDLKYAYFDGSVWHIKTVDSAGNVGWYTSLALDASGRPHISYYDFTNRDLKYAYFDGVVWHLETVDSTGFDVGMDTSLALDDSGRPHISYYFRYYSGNGGLKYAYFDGVVWHLEMVDSGVGDVGRFTSLALDGSGRPHISYCLYDFSHLACDDLKYAYFDGSAWQITTVDSAGNVGEYTSLALDASGRPHISYYDSTNGDLKYAYFDGSAWQITTVDGTGKVGMYTSLALDGSGRPHISYYDSTNGDLKYAYFNGSAWQITIVDSAGNVGEYTSLALDASGRPHISYYDRTNGDLKYAWECIPVTGTSISGPAFLQVGQTGFYTATYSPITATTPVTFTWNNGTVGPTAAYSWTLPSTYTVTVTATNPCGEPVTASLTVEVCQSVEGVSISGPERLSVGQTGLYTATYSPITATTPVTFTWDNGTVGPTAVYSWSVAGMYTVTVTGTNACSGAVVGHLPVEVSQFRVYLPLVMRNQ